MMIVLASILASLAGTPAQNHAVRETTSCVHCHLSGGGSGGGGPGGGGGGGGRSDPPREPRVDSPGSGGGHSGGDVRTSGDSGGGHGGGSGPSDHSGKSGDSGSSGSGSSGGSGASGSSGSGSGSSGSSGSSGTSGSGSNSGSGSSGSSGSGSSGSGSNSGSGSSGSDSSGSSSGHSEESVESVSEMHDLASRESPEFDRQGFPVRRGEVIGFDLSDGQINKARQLGFEVASDKRLKSLDMRVIRMRAPSDMTADQALQTLRKDDTVATYDFDHFYGVNGYEDSALRTPAKRPAIGNLWIGMIDTGVARHTALAGIRVDSRDFSLKAPRIDIPRKHGTAVASILAQRGAGRITSANIFTADGKPYAAADTIASALDWLVGQGVPVINISLAGPRNAILDRVVERAMGQGHLVVAAAGNGGPAAAPAYPAAIPGVIAATAVDADSHIYRYANQGSYVYVAAPGVGVSAASIDGKMAAFSGTSFAAPFIAATLATCKRHSAATTCLDQMRHEARDLGAPGRDPIYGYGVISH
jgi:Subtilase family